MGWAVRLSSVCNVMCPHSLTSPKKSRFADDIGERDEEIEYRVVNFLLTSFIIEFPYFPFPFSLLDFGCPFFEDHNLVMRRSGGDD